MSAPFRRRWRSSPESNSPDDTGGVEVFALGQLLSQLDPCRPDFEHFFTTEQLSLTVASWPVGSTDDQRPHLEDEVYFIAAGTGRLTVGGVDHEVSPGSVVHVRSGVEHRFHSITDRLEVLVFWSPPHAASPG